MERKPLSEHTPQNSFLRYLELYEKIENGTTTNLETLDELLTVGTQIFQAEARQGNELHEDVAKLGILYSTAKNGSFHEEKAQFCSLAAKKYSVMSDFYRNNGQIKLAQDALARASNWLQLSNLCLKASRR